MATRMLIDAAHPEETRVVVVRGTRLEEFDFESAIKRQLKGNIYLAKVTRVEPSLQAAFVDYGGNRHGFLPFNEIHPDYYQIPIADRESLLEQEAIESLAEAAAEEADAERLSSTEENDNDATDEVADDAPDDEADSETELSAGDDADASAEDGADQEVEAAPEGDETVSDAVTDEAASDAGEDNDDSEVADDAVAAEAVADEDEPRKARDKNVEAVGGDELDEVVQRRRRPNRRYKIQEVIKRRQILLVQVVKEERGNKGAALTTYLSLAGRYCVLMPNTARGGGVSRKITTQSDRKKLKTIIDDLSVPEGMGLIVRTAGQARSKAEIKRDYEYLLRLWDSVRELTLESTAPCLTYEEANLIKRSIRDLYNKEIDEILVEGDDGYRAAKNFMKMLMPSHAKRVQPYIDRIPLFHRYQVEQQFDGMHSPTVQLKSGGYIVINPTEALVAIDVNSGRATKERNIEETAYRTNLEAAEEVARQLRLRDLAGLIVIDFIDMDESRNARNVERRIKEKLKSDRARIQVGRISAFGLLEMSRQRLRPSLLEASTEICVHCEGSGVVRSIESSALHALRAIEEEGIRGQAAEILIHVGTPIAIYLLNQKRSSVLSLEERFDMNIAIGADDSLVPPDLRVERIRTRTDAIEEVAPISEVVTAPAVNDNKDEDDDAQPKKRRRRGKRGGRRRRTAAEENTAAEAGDNQAAANDTPAEGEQAEPQSQAQSQPQAQAGTETADGEEKPARKRRRRPRRRRGSGDAKAADGQTAETTAVGETQAGDDQATETPAPEVAADAVDVPVVSESVGENAPMEIAPVSTPAPAVNEIAPVMADTSSDEPDVIEPEIVQAVVAEEEAKPRRRGWWQRK